MNPIKYYTERMLGSIERMRCAAVHTLGEYYAGERLLHGRLLGEPRLGRRFLGERYLRGNYARSYLQ